MRPLLLLLTVLSLNAQEFDLKIYEWKLQQAPIHNIVVSWDGPCGVYTVYTNANVDTPNWGVYGTTVKHYWLNQQLMAVYTIIDAEQMFFNVTLVPDANQDGCPETQILILTHPYDQLVYTNEPTRFFAYAIGPDNVTYQWYKDGYAVAGATDSTYYISHTLPSDEGLYYLMISTASQNVTSQLAYLTVVEEASSPPIPDPPIPPSAMSSMESLIQWCYDPLAIIRPPKKN
jgi:hypothetical protein